jgi:Mitochondrial ATP synthase epsilon chain
MANKGLNSYNKYLSVAARVVRRSLKEDKRLQAERRGQMELRFAKWSVSGIFVEVGYSTKEPGLTGQLT